MTTIPTRTPHNEEIEVHLHSNKVPVDALKLTMRANGAKMGTGSMLLFDRERMQLLPDSSSQKAHNQHTNEQQWHDEGDGDEKSDEKHQHHHHHHHRHNHTIASLGVMSGDRIDIIQKMGTVNEADLLYKQFLVRSFPESMARDVSRTVTMSIQFVENAVGNLIYLPSYTLPHDAPVINQMQMDLGEDEAKLRGFTKWTDKVLPSKVHLLELDMSAPGPTVRDKFEGKRFNYKKANKGYLGVDVHSWQRYTTQMPVPCNVVVNTDATIPTDMTVTPQQPLKPDTWYALLLQNGVQLTPSNFLDSGISTFVHDSVCEDCLIYFWTSDEEPEVCEGEGVKKEEEERIDPEGPVEKLIIGAAEAKEKLEEVPLPDDKANDDKAEEEGTA